MNGSQTCLPFLLIPVVKESLGISLSTFLVTDKSGKKKAAGKKENLRYMIPFLILIAASVAGIVRILTIIRSENLFGMLIILFWMLRNLYSIIMSILLISGSGTLTAPGMCPAAYSSASRTSISTAPCVFLKASNSLLMLPNN